MEAELGRLEAQLGQRGGAEPGRRGWRGRSLSGAGRGLTEGDRCAAAAVCGGAAARAGRRPAMIASCLCYLLLPAARLFRSLSGTGLASRGAGSWGCALWRRRRGGGSAGPWGGGSGRASHPRSSAGGQQVWRWWLLEPRSAGRSGPTRLGLAGDSRGQPLLTLWSGDVGPRLTWTRGWGRGRPPGLWRWSWGRRRHSRGVGSGGHPGQARTGLLGR